MPSKSTLPCEFLASPTYIHLANPSRLGGQYFTFKHDTMPCLQPTWNNTDYRFTLCIRSTSCATGACYNVVVNLPFFPSQNQMNL